MKTLHRLIHELSLLALSLVAANAQVDTIDVSRDLLVMYLPEGRSQYSVSFQMPNGTIRYVGLWNRTVRFSSAGGKEQIVVEQDWWTSDSAAHRKVFSVCSFMDFTPLFHYSKDGKGKVEAYNFSDNRVTGSDTTAENSRKGFELALSMPTLNWELDLEIFRTLPYALNKTFVISFYHPGGPPPAYYSYVITAEETLALAGGGQADCWVMTIDYGSGRGATTFWISKKSREVLKTKDFFNGAYRYKVKLVTETK
jgi:hypothetical protein